MLRAVLPAASLGGVARSSGAVKQGRQTGLTSPSTRGFDRTTVTRHRHRRRRVVQNSYPQGTTFAWELVPPVTMPLLRQISHELLSTIWSQSDMRRWVYHPPTLVCSFDGTTLDVVPIFRSRLDLE
jgi:hypothetical protein